MIYISLSYNMSPLCDPGFKPKRPKKNSSMNNNLLLENLDMNKILLDC